MSAEDRRTVHGRSMSGEWEIVRYNRAGKWYQERVDGARIRIGVGHAARLAAVGTFYPNRPGGKTFDRKVRKLRVGSDKT